MEMKRMIFGPASAGRALPGGRDGCSAKVKEYRAEAVAEYLHDTGAYTQGLFFSGGRLYESTGQFGESSLRIVDLESGRVERQLDFNSKYFVEGSVILGDKLYVLTWTNRVAYVYDAATLEYVGGIFLSARRLGAHHRRQVADRVGRLLASLFPDSGVPAGAQREREDGRTPAAQPQ